MIFGSKKKTGTALIDDTIAKFNGYADDLDAGAQQNAETMDANDRTIAALSAANGGLNAARERALAVAAKLRSLVS